MDWERQNFSLSQCLFSENQRENIVAVNSTNDASKPPSSGSSSSSTGKTAGIAVGVVVGVLIIVSAIGGYLWYLRKKRGKAANELSSKDNVNQMPLGFAPKGELGTGIDFQRFEMEGSAPHQQRPETEASPSRWADEKANYPRDQSLMAEADGGNASVPELGSGGPLGSQYHEVDGSSSHGPPVELAADYPSEPEELQDSNRESVVRSRWSRKASKRSSMRPSWMRLSRNKSGPQSSTRQTSSFVPPPPPPPPKPSGGFSSSAKSNPSSPSLSERFGQVSRQGTLSTEDAGISQTQSNNVFSPISPKSPQQHQGLFGYRT